MRNWAAKSVEFVARDKRGTFSTGGDWAPSPKLSTLLSAVVAPFGAKTMQLQIGVSSGSALVDDLYVDPYLTKT